MKKISFVIVVLMAIISPTIADEGKVVSDFVERTVNEAVEILNNLDLDAQTKKDKISELAHGMFDIPIMARQVLGSKNGVKFSTVQLQEFTKLFVRQLEASYFDTVDIFWEAKFEYETAVKNSKAGAKRLLYKVPSHVYFRDKRYEILYKLYQVKDGWRVYDVVVEGISVKESYKMQYNQFLQNSTVGELLAKMREKNMELPEELKEKDKAFQETHGTNVVAAKSVEKDKKN